MKISIYQPVPILFLGTMVAIAICFSLVVLCVSTIINKCMIVAVGWNILILKYLKKKFQVNILPRLLITIETLNCEAYNNWKK